MLGLSYGDVRCLRVNSTANPWIYPRQFIPPGRAESHPNVSGSGFIDESPYAGPGTRL